MRKLLDALYAACGVAAAGFLVLICLTVAAQIGLRAIDNLAFLTLGERLGLMIPSAAEFSGFFLAAASFLALAPTLRFGGHIRMNLVIRRLPRCWRRTTEAFCLLLGAALSGWFAWHALLMAADSWQFGEVSFGIVPVPLWIPQTAMVAGLAVLAIAMVDDLVMLLRGGEPSYWRHERAEAALAGEGSEEDERR